MGFNSDRVVLSSRTLPSSAKRKPSHCNVKSVHEGKDFNQLSSGKQNNFSNAAADVAGKNYSRSSVREKSEEMLPKSCLRRNLKSENSCKSNYGNARKNFTGLNPLKDVRVSSKSKRSMNVKTTLKSEENSVKKNEKLHANDNAISCSHSRHHSPCPPGSGNPVKHHSRTSSISLLSGEDPNNAILKKERISISGNLDNSKAPLNVNDRTFVKGTSDNNQIESLVSGYAKNGRRLKSQPHNYQNNVSILSFGNIYRGLQNSVNETGPSRAKETCRNNIVLKLKGNEINSEELERVRTNSHVLGFGGGNYGHGSIIRGAVNVENRMGASSTPITGYNNVEELKNAGNEEYRRGRFKEAIFLYDKAIALCPRNAPCHNNKAAALASLGKYAEAVGECLEAIVCDPFCSRAHYRLGSLYTRLGRVEDAKWHLKLSGQQSDSLAMQKMLHLETHLLNMRKAQSIEDWNRVLAESTLAIDSGADASDQVLACKAEALLKLQKAKEALELLMIARKSEDNKSIKAHKRDSSLLIIEAQIHMYLGRFDDGIIAAERAVQLDCIPESLMCLQKARAVADARKFGNEFFKAGKYQEASMAYGKGLEYAPTNSVLLSNRAACRYKLGQWEMTVEDCNAALRDRPDYTKALLRRAHSNAKLERWEESLRDYKLLNQEMPGDVSIAHSLIQVQSELIKFQGEAYDLQARGQVTHMNSYVQFIKTIKSAGLALLQFFMKSDDRCEQLSPLVVELSQRYPSWNFLKVDVEENPDWANLESVKFVPIFIIYKDGLKLTEICKPDQQILEHALKFHSI